jgi:hypothetical protein
MERLLIWSRGRLLCIALTDLLNRRFVVAINLSCLFAFCCGLGCGGGCLFADLKLMRENDTDRTKSGENSDQELRSKCLLHGGSLLGQVGVPGLGAVCWGGGEGRSLLLNECGVVDLIRSGGALSHVLHSSLGCLAGVERALCL